MKQSEALNILKLGHSVFLTGPAGSGKTHLLRNFIDYLKSHRIGVAITASTGIAATHMGGMTIHSWSGLGIKDSLQKSDLEKILSTTKVKTRMDETKVLIIDEVSMLDANRLDMVDQICRAFKDPLKPFGGLQVVLSGDLFQLPPISKKGEETRFVFESKSWQDMNIKICYLEEQHRQENGDLLLILNAIRNSDTNEEHGRMLQERFVPVNQNVVVTKLYTHNADVDRINHSELAKLEADEQSYLMTSRGNKQLVSSMIMSCLAPELLQLKLGSEVMFVANSPSGKYVNGTRGKVVGFSSDDKTPLVHTVDDKTITAEPFTWKLEDSAGETIASITQVPLRLAWAITVHKSQGITLDAAEIDLSKSFEPGMGYVALSRVRSIGGLYLKGINQMALMINPKILEFDATLRSLSSKNQRAVQAMQEETLKKQHAHIQAQLGTPPDLKKNEVTDYDEALYTQLSDWRKSKADELSRPAYMIFSNDTLKHLAADKPLTNQDLLKVKGIGPQKADSYGVDVLKMIKQKTS